MSIRKIATAVAEEYINGHPGCDADIVHMIVDEAYRGYDKNKHTKPVLYFNLAIRNKLHIMRNETTSEVVTDTNNKTGYEMEVEKDDMDNNSTTEHKATEEVRKPCNSNARRITAEVREQIIADLYAGATKVDIKEKYGLGYSTVSTNISTWRKTGLIPADFKIRKAPRGRHVPKKGKGISEANVEAPQEPSSETTVEPTGVSKVDAEALQEPTVGTSEPPGVVEVNEVLKQVSVETNNIQNNTGVSKANGETDGMPELTWVTAHQNIYRFLENQLSGCKLVSVSADEEEQLLSYKYKRSDGTCFLLQFSIVEGNV